MNRRGYRGYNFSRSFLGERVPQHVQNLVIRDYARRNGLHYLLSVTEYTMPGSFMMLEQTLAELPILEGIIAYSIFQLPPNAKQRKSVYDRILAAEAGFHAASEGLVVASPQDVLRVEDIWRVRQALECCPSANAIAKSLEPT